MLKILNVFFPNGHIGNKSVETFTLTFLRELIEEWLSLQTFLHWLLEEDGVGAVVVWCFVFVWCWAFWREWAYFIYKSQASTPQEELPTEFLMAAHKVKSLIFLDGIFFLLLILADTPICSGCPDSGLEITMPQKYGLVLHFLSHFLPIILSSTHICSSHVKMYTYTTLSELSVFRHSSGYLL